MTRKVFSLLATLALIASAQAEPLNPNNTTTLHDEEPNAELPAADVEVADEEDDEWAFWWGTGVDLASNYVWRGYDQAYTGKMFDPAFQPCVTLGYGKFYLDFWLSVSPISAYHELDITLGFEHENLAITLYDVYCDFSAPFFSKRLENHSLTATIDYTFFDRLRLHWATTFLHPGDYIDEGKRAGKRAFSSYFEVAYTQPVKDWFDVEITAGASPWTAPYWCYESNLESVAKGFNVTNLSLMLNKEFEYNGCTFPLQVGYIYNPTAKLHFALLKAGFAF